MITYLKEDYPKLAERLAVPDEQLDKEICKALDLFDHGESYKGITAECVDYLPVDPTFMERLMIRYTFLERLNSDLLTDIQGTPPLT